MKTNTNSGSIGHSPQRVVPAEIYKQVNTNKPINLKSGSKSAKPLKKRVITVIIYILVAVIGLGTGGGIYIYQLVGKVGYTAVGVVDNADYTPVDIGSLDSQDVESGNTTSSWAQGGHTKVFVDSDFPIKKVKQKDANVENILVFGVDSRGTDDVDCRADAIMIVSLDNNTKTIKIISLMRDSAVTIEGRTKADKLTHSYAYGGVGLLINTINNNYGLDIQRFVMLDFSSSANLIDLVGGVDVDVKTNEVKYANGEINYQNGLIGSNEPLLTSSGLQTLSGIQAIAWARIRHLDSDFVRSSRQRVIASALMTKVASQNKLAQLSLLKNCAGIFETNMTQADLLRLGTVGVSLIKNIVQYRIPDDGLYTVQENPWMEIIDWEKQIPKLHEYIWGTSDI